VTLTQQLPEGLGASATLAAYRVVQEGLTNAVRHAKAQHVAIAVKAEGDSMVVSVTDDGVGMPEQWSGAGRFGLRGLKERVERLGGTLEACDCEPHGVRLTAAIPLVAGA
jgi:two-component system sensor histidine kinase UhpB